MINIEAGQDNGRSVTRDFIVDMEKRRRSRYGP